MTESQNNPFLSMVLVVYKMADQAERTLRSLSALYQRGVDESEYEIIVVENDSSWVLGKERACATGGNVRYFYRHETEPTPVHAVNFGAEKARGSHVVIMIDGARMVTPGVVRLTLDAFRAAPHSVVCVPGYHLGEKLQQDSVNEGYDEKTEAELLELISWPEDGYRLFDIAVFARSCEAGFFRPHSESNFLGISVERWKEVGGMDVRYNKLGGGMANIAIYKSVLEKHEIPLYLLFGEGSFHQFHGGLSTNSPRGKREPIMKQIKAQDAELRSDLNRPPTVPILFGKLYPSAYRFMQISLGKVYKP